MTRIDSSSALVALIRSQIVALNTQPSAKTADHPASQDLRVLSSKAQASDVLAGGAAPHSLPAALIRRIRGLSPDDPQRKRKALSMFMWAVLAQQLSISVGGSDFDQLVETVVDRMTTNPLLAQEIDDAAAMLLGVGEPIP